mmetsp:Transcript_24208/g.56453  ORF Transcript_24208/g.56453 Transcript_24208/m.56453 type:complete len:224 (-) Transcript_24208:208-879(-)
MTPLQVRYICQHIKVCDIRKWPLPSWGQWFQPDYLIEECRWYFGWWLELLECNQILLVLDHGFIVHLFILFIFLLVELFLLLCQLLPFHGKELGPIRRGFAGQSFFQHGALLIAKICVSTWWALGFHRLPQSHLLRFPNLGWLLYRRIYGYGRGSVLGYSCGRPRSLGAVLSFSAFEFSGHHVAWFTRIKRVVWKRPMAVRNVFVIVHVEIRHLDPRPRFQSG